MSNFSYETLHERYKNGIDCPDDFNFSTHVVDKWAASKPALPALHFVSHDFDAKQERMVSYSELSDLSHRAAKAFEAARLKKGDR
jgi:acyl-coenzyme A synthetase/AMP-(fatty) acid ligase